MGFTVRTDEEIKLDIKNYPENVEVDYNPRSRTFMLIDFNNYPEGYEGRIRYMLTKAALLNLLIEHGDFIS